MKDLSLIDLLPRVFVSMVVVIVVMYIAARVLQNRNVQLNGGTVAIGSKTKVRKTKKSVIEVLSRQGIGKNAAVSVVRAGDKVLVLGITDGQVTLLTELDELSEDDVVEVIEPTSPAQLSSVPTVASTPGADMLQNVLGQFRELTVRRSS